VLSARSIIKAHQDAQKSSKMCLYKAIPYIATGIVTTSLALTRPGKLSEKAATGLGFLAVMAGIKSADNLFKKDKTKQEKAESITALGALGAAALGVAAIKKGKSGESIFGKAVGFMQKEAGQLSKEIDSLKFEKYSKKHIEPFIKKYPKLSFAIPYITTIVTGSMATFSRLNLLKSISHDIKNDACRNFEKGKAIQKAAREHFDSIDAKEV